MSVLLDCPQYVQVKSEITGHVLTINKSDTEFLIPPDFDPSVVRSSVDSFLHLCESENRPFKKSRKLRQLFARFRAVNTRADYIAALLPAINEGPAIAGVRSASRLYEFLLWLRCQNALIWPRDYTRVFFRKQITDLTWVLRERNGDLDLLGLLTSFTSAFDGTDESSRRGQVTRLLLSTILSVGNLREAGDLTPSVLDGRLLDADVGRSTATLIIRVINATYPLAKIELAHTDYGPFSRNLRGDIAFRWVLTTDPTMEKWRDFAHRWLEGQLRSRAARRNALNLLLRLIMNDNAITRDPLAAVRVENNVKADGHFRIRFDEFKVGNQRSLSGFFDWILDTYCIEEGEHGILYRIPSCQNPIKATGPSRKVHSETVRESLPTRYIRILQEIIQEDEFAWPKSLRTDRFRWLNPDSGVWEDIWSPVRAYVILLKLIIPLRTFQVRMLNSGEGDAARYDPSSKCWMPNTNPLSRESGNVPTGVLRAIQHRATRREFVGLYINTNKTKDAAASGSERGYVIPWHHELAIKLLSDMRTWQEKYNPLRSRTAWSDLHEPYIKNSVHRDVLAERGAECFLFRDAASSRPTNPVTDSRMHNFWMLVCEQLEKRLSQLGERDFSGEPIKIVYRNERGLIQQAEFDLHSLRVTLLTSWAEQGVPIDILMKVAGHCTAIMAVYYQKYSIVHVSELLNKADVARMEQEQSDWERYLKARSLTNLEGLTAWNDLSGITAMTQGSGMSWQRRDCGICPVGGARCSDGGEEVGHIGSGKFGPVPGGAQNCVRCRFFVTGPAFLFGLFASFNDCSFRLKEASRRFSDAEKQFLSLDHERRIASTSGRPFELQIEWKRASISFERCTREVDDLALSFHATYRLIERCKELLNQEASGSDGAHALVAVGTLRDIEFVLETDSNGEREFELLDVICQSSIVFQSIDASKPNLRRMRFFDSMLQRSGHAASFVQMTESEALLVGNKLAKFMFTRYGRDEALAILNGQKLLSDLGVVDERDTLRVIETAGSDIEVAVTTPQLALGA